MKTFELSFKVAGGMNRRTVKAHNMMEAIEVATKSLKDGLTELSQSLLEEVSIKEI